MSKYSQSSSGSVKAPFLSICLGQAPDTHRQGMRSVRSQCHPHLFPEHERCSIQCVHVLNTGMVPALIKPTMKMNKYQKNKQFYWCCEEKEHEQRQNTCMSAVTEGGGVGPLSPGNEEHSTESDGLEPDRKVHLGDGVRGTEGA